MNLIKNIFDHNKGFSSEFDHWLTKSLNEPIPPEVKAFSFNLFEPASGGFGIEIIGAPDFDEDDPDWACNEIWAPKQRQLEIPIKYSGSKWRECLAKMTEAVCQYLEKGDKRAVLTNSIGIGIGFVDGDLNIVWKP